jgi:hypothetical protein
MKLSVTWHPSIRLRSPVSRLHSDFDLDALPREPAVYLFARCFGKSTEVLYVGKATSLRSRIKQQFNNLRLMQAIDDARIGHRILIYGTLNCRPGQRVNTVLNIVETALIGHLTEQKHQLSNKLGTKLPVHVISFDGNLVARQTIGRELRVPKRRSLRIEID